ncbi:hypothetical protein AVEN_243439-1 [Araneus ventricosus]|uniref:Uncharacterized protein n=1 Tax=Araneus ventricosus TaxID=182803 RepID=A0A4Y2L800_ARAVE|nr:hypothetical protein AVEN_243439-1 [Araneus ventricosus]
MVNKAVSYTSSQLFPSAFAWVVWAGPCNFEWRSDDEEDTTAVKPSPNFRTTPAGGRMTITYDLACNRPHTGGSSVESGFEPGNLRSQSRELTTGPPRLPNHTSGRKFDPHGVRFNVHQA